MSEDSDIFREIAAQDHTRALGRARQKAFRKRLKEKNGGLFAVQIFLSQAEMLALEAFQKSARDPYDFRKRALMQGAKFVANTSRGKGKIKGTNGGAQ